MRHRGCWQDYRHADCKNGRRSATILQEGAVSHVSLLPRRIEAEVQMLIILWVATNRKTTSCRKPLPGQTSLTPTTRRRVLAFDWPAPNRRMTLQPLGTWRCLHDSCVGVRLCSISCIRSALRRMHGSKGAPHHVRATACWLGMSSAGGASPGVRHGKLVDKSERPHDASAGEQPDMAFCFAGQGA